MDDRAAAPMVAEPLPTSGPDILISYCTKIDPSDSNDRRGEAAMLGLACQLGEASIMCYHGLMAGGGQDWRIEWFGRVRTARAVILMLSPAYFASKSCVRELRAVLSSERLQGRILPVIIGDGVREALQGDFAIGETPDASRAREFIRDQIAFCGNWVPPPREGVYQSNAEVHSEGVIQWFRDIQASPQPREGKLWATQREQTPDNVHMACRLAGVNRWIVPAMTALVALGVGYALSGAPSDPPPFREELSGPPPELPSLSTLPTESIQPTQTTAVATQSRARSANIPVVTRFFTGREKELALISSALNDSGVCGIVATGGMGKTQLMAKYVEDHLHEYSPEHVHWIVANSTSELAHGLSTLADGFGTPSTVPDDLRVSASVALNALAKYPSAKWLLCVDNADDRGQTDANGISVIGHLATFWAKLRRLAGKSFAGHVMITSRFGDESVWHQFGTSAAANNLIRLGPLQPKSAASMLMRYKLGLPKTSNVISYIAELSSADRTALYTLCGSNEQYSLNGHPLAVQQAGAYIVRHQKSFSDYLRDYISQFEAKTTWNLLPKIESEGAGLETHQRSVQTTWLLNINQLSPEAKRVLNAAAQLHPDYIPGNLLKQVVVVVTGDSDAVTFDKLVLDELVNWSMLLSRVKGASAITREGGFSMHRVIRFLVLHRERELESFPTQSNLDMFASFQTHCQLRKCALVDSTSRFVPCWCMDISHITLGRQTDLGGDDLPSDAAGSSLEARITEAIVVGANWVMFSKQLDNNQRPGLTLGALFSYIRFHHALCYCSDPPAGSSDVRDVAKSLVFQQLGARIWLVSFRKTHVPYKAIL